jgi:hypothetical protein
MASRKKLKGNIGLAYLRRRLLGRYIKDVSFEGERDNNIRLTFDDEGIMDISYNHKEGETKWDDKVIVDLE